MSTDAHPPGLDTLSNFASSSLEAMPSVRDPGIGVHRAPLVMASEASLEGYGHFVDAFDPDAVEIVSWPQQGTRPIVPGTGKEGGVVTDRFVFERRGQTQFAVNHAVKRAYLTGWFDDPATASETADPEDPQILYTHEANYHPDGGQIFFPMAETPFVALLALPGDDLHLEHFRAFYFDGTRGVHVDPGVWHQPIYPIAEKADFSNAQGRVHACVSASFLDEFGAYVAVPLPRF